MNIQRKGVTLKSAFAQVIFPILEHMQANLDQDVVTGKVLGQPSSNTPLAHVKKPIRVE